LQSLVVKEIISSKNKDKKGKANLKKIISIVSQ
jgi:hypothetical protein